jgi:hypothetical protein
MKAYEAATSGMLPAEIGARRTLPGTITPAARSHSQNAR